MFLQCNFCHLCLSSSPSQPSPLPSSLQLLYHFFLFTLPQLLPLLTFASPHLSLFYFFNLVFSNHSPSLSHTSVAGDTQLVVSGIFESYLTTSCSDPAMNKVVFLLSLRTLHYYLSPNINCVHYVRCTCHMVSCSAVSCLVLTCLILL
jgi:hypothetical protein